jgi:hypothetical protein
MVKQAVSRWTPIHSIAISHQTKMEQYNVFLVKARTQENNISIISKIEWHTMIMMTS